MRGNVAKLGLIAEGAFKDGGRKFRTIERGADELPSDLAAQLHLVVRTLADPPKVGTVRGARPSGRR